MSTHSRSSASGRSANTAVTLFYAVLRPSLSSLSPIKELDRGTLRAIIRQASLSIDEFNALL